MTRSRRLVVRRPDWAEAGETMVTVNGKAVTPEMQGAYFDLGRLSRGTDVRIDFPDRLIHKKETIGDTEFSTTWRGNAVVRMEPAGEIYPLYQDRERKDGVIPIPFANAKPINPF